MNTRILSPLRRGRRSWLVAAAGVLVTLVAVVLAVLGDGSANTGPAPAEPSPDFPHLRFTLTDDEVTTAERELASLEVREKADADTYKRDAFGPPWTDGAEDVAFAGNGCDTRNDILDRDLYDVVKRDDGCVVLSGRLWDPYTGRAIDFERGPATSGAVQIDHIVALSDAWKSGASKMSDRDRVRIANDPINLIAGDGPANMSKGDKDAAAWLPPYKPTRCYYAASQVRVKAKYGLSVTPAERDALAHEIGKCPGI